jgi:hypothetical protein
MLALAVQSKREVTADPAIAGRNRRLSPYSKQPAPRMGQ